MVERQMKDVGPALAQEIAASSVINTAGDLTPTNLLTSLFQRDTVIHFEHHKMDALGGFIAELKLALALDDAEIILQLIQRRQRQIAQALQPLTSDTIIAENLYDARSPDAEALDRAQQENTRLNTSLEQLKQQLEAVKSELAAAQQQNERLGAENETLQAEVKAAATTASPNVEQSTALVDELRGIIQKLELEVGNKGSQISTLEARVRELEAENAQLRAKQNVSEESTTQPATENTETEEAKKDKRKPAELRKAIREYWQQFGEAQQREDQLEALRLIMNAWLKVINRTKEEVERDEADQEYKAVCNQYQALLYGEEKSADEKRRQGYMG